MSRIPTDELLQLPTDEKLDLVQELWTANVAAVTLWPKERQLTVRFSASFFMSRHLPRSIRLWTICWAALLWWPMTMASSVEGQQVRVIGTVVAENHERRVEVGASRLESHWESQIRRAATTWNLSVPEKVPIREQLIDLGSEGEFSAELSPGVWHLRAGIAGSHEACIVVPTLSSPMELPLLELTPPESFVLRVADDEGHPIEGAGVRVVPETAPKVLEWAPCTKSRRADEDGRVALPELPESARLSVHAPGFVEKTLTVGELSRSGWRLALSTAQAASVDLRLRNTEGNLPIVNAVLSYGEGRWPLAVSDREGSIRKTGVPGAEAGRLYLTTQEGGEIGPFSADELIEITEIEIDPQLPIRGRVVEYFFEEGEVSSSGVEASSVMLALEPRVWASAADGYFQLSLPREQSEGGAATLVIQVVVFAPGYVTKSYEIGIEAAGEAEPWLELSLEPSASDLSLKGVVVGPSGAPLAGVEMSLLLSAPEMLLAWLSDVGKSEVVSKSYTNVRGEFRLETRRRDYFLVAFREGLSPLVLRLRLGSYRSGEADLGELKLADTWTLTGKVVDSEGEPVSGARVQALHGATLPGGAEATEPLEWVDTVLTSKDGSFTLPGVPTAETTQGYLSLQVSKVGFATSTVANVQHPIPDPIEILLERTGTATGRVTGASGRPLAEAGVTLLTGAVEPAVPQSTLDERGSLSQATTTRGTFEFRDLTPGGYRLLIRADGYQAMQVEIEVGPGAESREDVELIPGSRLRGFVLTPDGVPIEAARVSAEGSETFSDATGYFEFDGLAPRPDGWVVAEHKDYGRSERRVDLTGGYSNQIELVLRPDLVLQGRVLGPDLQPIPHAFVRVDEIDEYGQSRLIGSTLATPEGDFGFRHLTAGSYRIGVTSTGLCLSGGSVQVGLPSDADIDLLMAECGQIEGRVLGLDGTELPRVEVTLDCGHFRREGSVDPTGAFLFDGIPLGDCILNGSVSGSSRSASARVHLGENEPTTHAALEFRDGSKINGRVLVDGRPAAGARISVHSLAGLRLGETRANWNGEFQFGELEPGSVRVSVETDLLQLPVTRVFVPSSVRENEISIATGSVTARLTDRRGQEIVSARVSAHLAGSSTGRSFALRNGSMHLPSLPEGELILRFYAPGYQEELVTTQIVPGDTIDLDLTLTSMRTPFRIRLSTHSGRPPSHAFS